MRSSRDVTALLLDFRRQLTKWRTCASERLQQFIRWLTLVPTYLWAFPFRTIRSAIIYLARQPLFVIRFKAPQPKREDGTLPVFDEHAQLMLKSTKAVWLWCAVSTTSIAFAITANPVVAGVGTAISLSWLIATGLLSRHSGSPELQEFAGTALYGASPPAMRWKRFATWTPAALFCTLGSAYAFLTALQSWSTSSPQNFTRAYGAAPFLVTAFVVALALMGAEFFFYRHFHLPGLQSWYRRMPYAVKQLLEPSLNQQTWRRRFFSSTWRTMPDIASELNTAGTYVALFSEDRRNRPIWRRSRAGLVWYFAPLIVPLSALTFTPLLMALLPCYGGMDERTKVAYACGAVVWAAWSFCYFLYFCARDFVEPQRYSNARYGPLSHVLLFDNMHDRREVEAFFVGSGKTAYDALIVLVPAAFIGFLGLFSSPAGPVVAHASVCCVLCYDVLRHGCESILLAQGALWDTASGAVRALLDSIAQHPREMP